MKALSSRQRPVNVVVAGGSISLGHGVTPTNARYAERLEKWMNDLYPLQNNDSMNHNDQNHIKEHKVINVAAHGADMCSMAKRLNIFYQDLSTQILSSSSPDLIILEFAVNDYQGQDHIITVDSKTTVFFDGFRELELCAEAVIHSLRMKYPNTTQQCYHISVLGDLNHSSPLVSNRRWEKLSNLNHSKIMVLGNHLFLRVVHKVMGSLYFG